MNLHALGLFDSTKDTDWHVAVFELAFPFIKYNNVFCREPFQTRQANSSFYQDLRKCYPLLPLVVALTFEEVARSEALQGVEPEACSDLS